MKIVHLADTHLGYAAYSKRAENGFNQREEDIINAFIQAVNRIIDIKPAVVLHSGDLFHTVRPTNRIVSIGIRELFRIYKNNIPFVLISGNHETPKQLYSGSIYNVFEALDLDKSRFKILYKDKYDTFQINGLTVHAIPQCSSDEIFRREIHKLDETKLDNDIKNILMLHAGVKGMKEFSHGDSNELLVDYEWLKDSKMDYIALGHYHKLTNVVGNAWYSGSTERMSFNEIGPGKCFLLVDLSQKQINVDPKFLDNIRVMDDVPPIDATGKDTVALLDTIITKINSVNPKDKILRLTIKNIPQHVMSTLDTKLIKDTAKESTHFEVKYERISEEGMIDNIKVLSGGAKEEFKTFLATKKDMSKDDQDQFFDWWSKFYDKTIKEEEEKEI